MSVDPEKIKMRQRSSAQMLLKSDYPESIKAQMQRAFDLEDFVLVTEIAASHDTVKREALDSKITMVVPDNSDAINEFDEAEDVAIHKAIVAGTMKKPYFTAEGVEGEFETAGEAIEAYKRKNGIAIPDKKRHTFRSKPILVPAEELDSPVCTNHGEVEQMLKEMFSDENDGETDADCEAIDPKEFSE